MADHLTPAQRHHCMSRIPHEATKPEMAVRRWLWAHGYRYRLNFNSVPGKPDIVMRKYNYPPEGQEQALEIVMEQCNQWAD